ncbi:MAG: methionine--tRNA ligase subunit beta [Planctomycetota bacterium]
MFGSVGHRRLHRLSSSPLCGRAGQARSRFSRLPHARRAMAFKDTISFDDFVKIDLRVATIVEAELHPNADRLLKLQVDLGEERRQLCAGIKGAYDPDALVGRQIVVVANLAPRKIRGEESNGMLLAASVADEDGGDKQLTLITPGDAMPPGATVG